MHGEDRHRGILGCDQRAVGQAEGEDEVVEAILLPGVDRVDACQARVKRAIIWRPLEGDEEHGVGARKIVAHLLLTGDLVV